MHWVVNATSYGDPPGGAGLRARHLFGALHGHEVTFLLARDTPSSVVPPGAATVRLPVTASAPFDRWRRLRPPDLGDIFCTDHYPVHPTRPTIVTLHDQGGPWWRRRLIAGHLRKAARVVAVSETVRRAWSDIVTDAVVIPNGVAVPAGVDTVSPGSHVLLCDPGVPHKGADLARAAARAAGRPLREVGRGVRWLPHDALLREIAGAGAVVCPATEEGFGMVALEALALGRPLVVSDIPAFREVLGETPRYVATRDPRDWAAALDAACVDDPDRREAGRAHARRYSWERSAAVLADQPAATV